MKDILIRVELNEDDIVEGLNSKLEKYNKRAITAKFISKKTHNFIDMTTISYTWTSDRYEEGEDQATVYLMDGQLVYEID